MAATPFSSAPYLTAVPPQSIRSSSADPPFEFVPLRALPADPVAESDPETADSVSIAETLEEEETAMPFNIFPPVPNGAEFEEANSSQTVPETHSPSPPEDANHDSPAMVEPVARPAEVRLEDFLPFFPETRPASSRATYQKK